MANKWIRADAQKSLKRLHDVVDDAWKESKHRSKRAGLSIVVNVPVRMAEL